MFAEKFKQLRLQHHLTQAEMGQRLSVDPSRISRWEHDELPTIHMVKRISKEFAVDALQWLGKEDLDRASSEPVQADALRIVHLEQEAEPDPGMNKRDERSLRAFIKLGIRYFKKKLKKTKKKKALDRKPLGGEGK